MLNPQQQEAVRYLDGPLLVLAGAGSGKTSVITQKIAHLLRSGLYGANEVAAITFTNKAAREMRERVARLLGEGGSDGLTVSTFHALGLRFLEIEHAHAGLRRGFSILGEDDARAIVKELAPKGAANDVLERLRSLIGRAKSQGLSPEQACALAQTPREREAGELYGAYAQRLAAFNAVDFDDLIALPVRVLDAQEDVRAKWQRKLRYLLIDEYQDTNDAQYRLLRLLAGERGLFTAVGDDDQSIYAWRGANPENLEGLGRDYPRLKVVKLEQNYRCAQRILRAANAVIGQNPHLHPKKLWSALPEGDRIRIVARGGDGDEAEFVAMEIVHRRLVDQLPPRDFAVLFRSNHQARALELALRAQKLPYHLSGATSFFDRQEIKDVMAYLRLLANPEDDAAFVRAVATPRRDIGTATLEKLAQAARGRGLPLARAADSQALLATLPPRAARALGAFAGQIEGWRRAASGIKPRALIEKLIAEAGLAQHWREQDKNPELAQRRVQQVQAFLEWIGDRRESSLAQLLTALMLESQDDEPGDRVRLMTLHSAKGLEFRHVYLVGCEDGILPHVSSLDEGREDEERRLFYVGMTRAKETLTLSFCRVRSRYGREDVQEPSRFLKELPESEVRWVGKHEKTVKSAEEKAAAARPHLDAIRALLGVGPR
ncbi:MAG: UvrD-helicase domain-containing protein [Xanthomonadales bacterium]|nr:UvrD-helicase domain-containing protein [Xanthomonadales bacterium]